jgi:hypothetical protein
MPGMHLHHLIVILLSVPVTLSQDSDFCYIFKSFHDEHADGNRYPSVECVDPKEALLVLEMNQISDSKISLTTKANKNCPQEKECHITFSVEFYPLNNMSQKEPEFFEITTDKKVKGAANHWNPEHFELPFEHKSMGSNGWEVDEYTGDRVVDLRVAKHDLVTSKFVIQFWWKHHNSNNTDEGFKTFQIPENIRMGTDKNFTTTTTKPGPSNLAAIVILSLVGVALVIMVGVLFYMIYCFGK